MQLFFPCFSFTNEAFPPLPLLLEESLSSSNLPFPEQAFLSLPFFPKGSCYVCIPGEFGRVKKRRCFPGKRFSPRSFLPFASPLLCLTARISLPPHERRSRPNVVAFSLFCLRFKAERIKLGVPRCAALLSPSPPLSFSIYCHLHLPILLAE